jgi:predicted glutamine amidotransferase
VDAPLQASFGVADGDSLWAVRYASEGVPRSLFASSDVEAIQRLHSDNPRLQRLSPGDRLIVSEPVNELPGLWHEIEPSTAVTVRRGGVLEHRPFRPRPEGPPLIVRQFAGTADG